MINEGIHPSTADVTIVAGNVYGSGNKVKFSIVGDDEYGNSDAYLLGDHDFSCKKQFELKVSLPYWTMSSGSR
jgi:hypothetical protein